MICWEYLSNNRNFRIKDVEITGNSQWIFSKNLISNKPVRPLQPILISSKFISGLRGDITPSIRRVLSITINFKKQIMAHLVINPIMMMTILTLYPQWHFSVPRRIWLGYQLKYQNWKGVRVSGVMNSWNMLQMNKKYQIRYKEGCMFVRYKVAKIIILSLKISIEVTILEPIISIET